MALESPNLTTVLDRQDNNKSRFEEKPPAPFCIGPFGPVFFKTGASSFTLTFVEHFSCAISFVGCVFQFALKRNCAVMRT